MRFKKWLALQETMTSTADVAVYAQRTLPVARRWWVSDWEDELHTGKKKKKKPYEVPQIKESSNYDFSCVMFNLPKDQAKDVISWTKDNVSKRDFFTDGEKGLEDDPHITVLYGLHSSQIDPVIKKLDGFKSGKVQLGKVSKFESKNYDVLKIEVDGDILYKMNKALKELPYTSTYAYKPHLTLAYVKKGSCDHLLGNNDLSGHEFVIDKLIWSPAYGEKQTFSLGK